MLLCEGRGLIPWQGRTGGTHLAGQACMSMAQCCPRGVRAGGPVLQRRYGRGPGAVPPGSTDVCVAGSNGRLCCRSMAGG